MDATIIRFLSAHKGQIIQYGKKALTYIKKKRASKAAGGGVGGMAGGGAGSYVQQQQDGQGRPVQGQNPYGQESQQTSHQMTDNQGGGGRKQCYDQQQQQSYGQQQQTNYGRPQQNSQF